MPRNFYALCRVNGTDIVRRIPVQAQVQADLESLFDQQEKQFLEGRDEEIVFNGDWKPDENHLLTIEDAALAAPLSATVGSNPTTYKSLDISNYAQAGIKAVFSHSVKVPGRVLIQRFRTSQYLQKAGVTLIFTNNQFNKLSEQGFSLDARLTAILEANVFKFQSFVSLRTILTVQEHYQEATAQEVKDFGQHASFHVENMALFEANMDERARKLIRGINRSKVLENYDVDEISEKAKLVGMELVQRDGKLVLPSEKKELKAVLSFLEESVYKGVFTDATFLTNSKRPLA